MAFFSKRKLSPIESFESALKDKHVAREKLSDRLRAAEMALGEIRTAATRLAMAGAADAQLDWAEADMRAAEDRTKTLRTALAQLDEQVAATKRELAAAKTQRDRELVANELQRMATAIEQAAPNYDAAVVALVVDYLRESEASIPETTRFATNLDAVRREFLSAAEFICAQLRSTAARTRAGNANLSSPCEPRAGASATSGNERQLVYTLNPVPWREGGEDAQSPERSRRLSCGKCCFRSRCASDVDYLEAQRMRTLMQVHGSGQFYSTLQHDDPQLVDLDALAAQEMRTTVPMPRESLGARHC